MISLASDIHLFQYSSTWCIDEKHSPTRSINSTLPMFFQVSMLLEKMLSADLSYDIKINEVVCCIRLFSSSSGNSSRSSTGVLSSHEAVLSRLDRYLSCFSIFLANFSILLITIMADRRRSLARWKCSNSLVATTVNIREMVVPIIIIPICFQNPLFLGLILIRGGLMSLNPGITICY